MQIIAANYCSEGRDEARDTYHPSSRRMFVQCMACDRVLIAGTWYKLDPCHGGQIGAWAMVKDDNGATVLEEVSHGACPECTAVVMQEIARRRAEAAVLPRCR